MKIIQILIYFFYLYLFHPQKYITFLHSFEHRTFSDLEFNNANMVEAIAETMAYDDKLSNQLK